MAVELPVLCSTTRCMENFRKHAGYRTILPVFEKMMKHELGKCLETSFCGLAEKFLGAYP